LLSIAKDALAGCAGRAEAINEKPAVSGDAHRAEVTRAVPFKATLFDKSPASNWLVPWHQDTALPLQGHNDNPEWGPWSQKAGITYAQAPGWALRRIIALRLHLDAGTAQSGPLRVVPDSHRHGVLSSEEVARLVRQNGFVECPVPRGGVLMMRPLAVHSSTKASAPLPRRVLHIEYTVTLNLAPSVTLAPA
jgi:ectoine hydroxylase-related dioxygenase (phytanoyl-CoA dioxygenase family)